MAASGQTSEDRNLNPDRLATIRRHLEQVLASKAFAGSKRSQDFLRLVVEHKLAGRLEELRERMIGAEMFGRPVDYDTANDAVVRVKAIEVRRRLARYYEEAQEPDVVRIEMPSGAYVPEFHWAAAQESAQPDSAVEAQLPATGPKLKRSLNFRWIWLSLTVPAAIAVYPLVNVKNPPAVTMPGALSRLTWDSGFTTDGEISPDGGFVAYASDRATTETLNIYVQEIKGRSISRFTDGPADDYDPAFSPDDTQIAFRSERNGGGIYQVSALGGTARLVIPNGRGQRFSPDGRYLLYWKAARGAGPDSVLLGSDGNLYGVTSSGGLPAGVCVDCGTVFELEKLGPQSPTLTSLAPNSALPGAQVTITGANFTGATSVQVGAAAAKFTVMSDTQINAQVPSGAGRYPLIVTTPDGSAVSVPPFETGLPLTTIYGFCPSSPFPNCPDGVNPNSLILGADGNFYGTSQQGGYFTAPTVCNPDPDGAKGCGTIFKLTPSGTFTQLYEFKAHGDGSYPWAGVVEGSDGLYGATSSAGAGGQGTIYRLSAAGPETLYSFSGADGSAPSILVAAKNNTLYGITAAGGASGKGTVFSYNPGGSLTTLYSFTGTADGGTPSSLILLPGGDLYGATSTAGAADGGTVFQLTSGMLVTLFNFSSSISGSGPANLVAGSNRLFGNTGGGGLFGGGTIFELGLTGELLTLYSFFNSATPSFGGYTPTALVRAPDGSFYGVTAAGGALSCQYGQGCGTVFHLSSAL